MAKTTKTTKTNQPSPSEGPRQLKKPTQKYKSFRLHKRIKSDKPLPSAFKLLRQSVGVLTKHWKLFVGISVVYGLLSALLAGGFSAASNLSDIKATLDEVLVGGLPQLVSGVSLFFYLLGSSKDGNGTNPGASSYKFILIIVVSLALIWALRQVYAGNYVRLRDAFYRGLSPLVPFLLVLLVVALQLSPLAVGSLLYSTVVSNGIAVVPLEYFVWGLLCFLLAVLSLYMICSSLFALYIVSLPDMTPMKALRSARQLVLHRRWSVMRKILFLPFVLVLAGAIVVVPFILFATPLASWALFIISMFLLPAVHSYVYALYRSLL